METSEYPDSAQFRRSSEFRQHTFSAWNALPLSSLDYLSNLAEVSQTSKGLPETTWNRAPWCTSSGCAGIHWYPSVSPCPSPICILSLMITVPPIQEVESSSHHWNLGWPQDLLSPASGDVLPIVSTEESLTKYPTASSESIRKGGLFCHLLLVWWLTSPPATH